MAKTPATLSKSNPWLRQSFSHNWPSEGSEYYIKAANLHLPLREPLESFDFYIRLGNLSVSVVTHLTEELIAHFSQATRAKRGVLRGFFGSGNHKIEPLELVEDALGAYQENFLLHEGLGHFSLVNGNAYGFEALIAHANPSLTVLLRHLNDSQENGKILEFSYRKNSGQPPRWLFGKVVGLYPWGFRVAHHYGVRSYRFASVSRVRLSAQPAAPVGPSRVLKLEFQLTSEGTVVWFTQMEEVGSGEVVSYF